MSVETMTPSWTTPKGTAIRVVRIGLIFPHWRVQVQRKDTDLIEYYGPKYPNRELAVMAAKKLSREDV